MILPDSGIKVLHLSLKVTGATWVKTYLWLLVHIVKLFSWRALSSACDIYSLGPHSARIGITA